MTNETWIDDLEAGDEVWAQLTKDGHFYRGRILSREDYAAEVRVLVYHGDLEIDLPLSVLVPGDVDPSSLR